MKYSEWVKIYVKEITSSDPMKFLFDAFELWLKEHPEVKPSVPQDYGFRDVLDILFANGIIEG